MDTSANATAAIPNGLPPLPDGLTMDNTYGAALLGTFFALMYVFFLSLPVCGARADEVCLRMYGVLLHQTYNYFRVHSADTSWTKFYVSTLALCYLGWPCCIGANSRVYVQVVLIL